MELDWTHVVDTSMTLLLKPTSPMLLSRGVWIGLIYLKSKSTECYRLVCCWVSLLEIGSSALVCCVGGSRFLQAFWRMLGLYSPIKQPRSVSNSVEFTACEECSQSYPSVANFIVGALLTPHTLVSDAVPQQTKFWSTLFLHDSSRFDTASVNNWT